MMTAVDLYILKYKLKPQKHSWSAWITTNNISFGLPVCELSNQCNEILVQQNNLDMDLKFTINSMAFRVIYLEI